MRRGLRDEAVVLRKGGKSYTEISQALSVGKSTLHYWLKDIQLTDEQIKALPKAGGQGGRAYKKKWEEKREQVRNNYVPPLDDVQFIVGLVLYWGEGSKYDASTVEITNSDPCVVKAFVQWTRDYFGHDDFAIRVQHHCPEKDAEIRDFWANLLELPLSSFTKSNFLSVGSNRKNRCPNGIARVRVRGKGWETKQKIEKSLEKLKIALDSSERLTI